MATNKLNQSKQMLLLFAVVLIIFISCGGCYLYARYPGHWIVCTFIDLNDANIPNYIEVNRQICGVDHSNPDIINPTPAK
jgi:hypothetical protein